MLATENQMNLCKVALSILVALFVALGAFTAATPVGVSADVLSLEMPGGLVHSVETCAPGAGVCSVIKIEAEDDDGDLFIKTDGGTMRVINASVGPFAEPVCPFDGSGTSSVTIHTNGCDDNTTKNNTLVVTLSLTPDCSAGGVGVGAQVLGEPQTLKSGFATCRSAVPTPPRTGDAGLGSPSGDNNLLLVIVATLAAPLTIAVLRYARK